jgi:tetratricopeptide (TPR) repeat protein
MNTCRIARTARSLALTTLVAALLLSGAPAAGAAPADRFDYLVRADFFAGIAGDRARLDRAMKVCEDALAADPRHAEAMVWHGAGLIVRDGHAAQAGEVEKAGPLTTRGLAEMDAGARLAPANIAVLIVRAAVLTRLARVPVFADREREWLETAVAHYGTVLTLQAPDFATMSVHARGELLGGLAENLDRLGQHDRARHYLTRIVSELPQSTYATRARSWLAAESPSSRASLSCVGCHVR